MNHNYQLDAMQLDDTDFYGYPDLDFPELDYELSEEEILWLETHKSEPEPEGYYTGSHCYG